MLYRKKEILKAKFWKEKIKKEKVNQFLSKLSKFKKNIKLINKLQDQR
jgi:hypothetical protein